MKMSAYKISDNFQRMEGCKMTSPHHSHPTNGVRPSDSRVISRKGGSVLKRVTKRVPVVGLVFVYTDIRDKGFSGGLCNSLLDACPFVGWSKLAAECIWGDWFPDNEDHIND